MARSLPRRALRLRPLTSADASTLDAVFGGLSAASRHQRFLAPVDELSARSRAALLDVDGVRHAGVVAEIHRRGTVTPVGIARFARTDDGSAELAYEVVDAWQGHGIGRALVTAIVRLARDRGVERVHASVLRDNLASLALLRRTLPQLRIDEDGAVVEVSAWLVEPPLTAADLHSELARV